MKLAFIEILEIEQIPKGINTIMQSITYAPTYNTPPSPECNTSSQPQDCWTFPPGEGGLRLWTLPALMQREAG